MSLTDPHGSGSVIAVGEESWQCRCGERFINGAAWLKHSKSFREPPKNWIELAVPLTGVTIAHLIKFIYDAEKLGLWNEAPVQVTTRQGVGNDKWQTYVVLRADRDTPMPDWLKDAQAQEASYVQE